MAKRPGGAMVQETEATRSQLIPLVTKWEEIGKKAQLGPILFCIAAYFALRFFGDTNPILIHAGDDGLIFTSNFLILLSFLLTAFSFYFIYRVVGKNKSWLVILGAFAFTSYFMWLFYTQHSFGWLFDFFHVQLAGEKEGTQRSLPQWVLGTGFFEEFTKAIPVLFLMIVTPRMSPRSSAMPTSVTTRACEMPSANVAGLGEPPRPSSRKLRIMPQTVPTSPSIGPSVPMVAR